LPAACSTGKELGDVNQRFTTAIGALIIAAVFFSAGVLYQKRICPQNVNPIGFHAQGEVVIEKNGFSVPTCTKKKPCTLRFDFWTNTAASNPLTYKCTSSNCFLAHGSSLQVTDNSAGATPYTDEVKGVVEVNPQ
jgi:hypothetical protein